MTTPSFLNLTFLPVRRLMTVNFEKRIISELKVLKDKEFINKSTYKSTKSVGVRQAFYTG